MAQIRRYEKIKALNLPEITAKRCTKCHLMKRVPEDYLMKKRTLANGEKKEYASGECRKCGAKRAAAWREKKRQEGTLTDAQRVWNSRRDPEHRRAYQREYETARRRARGDAYRGPWKRYRNLNEPKLTVPREPLAEWIRTQYHYIDSQQEIANLLKIDEAVLRRLLTGWQYDKRTGKRVPYKTVTIDLADRILTNAGNNTPLAVLYPDLYD